MMTNDGEQFENAPDDDRRLDSVVRQLREEAVPPVPEALFVPNQSPKSANRHVRVFALVVALAASLLLAVATFLRNGDQVPGVSRVTGDEIEVTPLSSLANHDELLRDLDGLEAELAELRDRALLLDVYQRTQSLLAQN